MKISADTVEPSVDKYEVMYGREHGEEWLFYGIGLVSVMRGVKGVSKCRVFAKGRWGKSGAKMTTCRGLAVDLLLGGDSC